MELHNLPKGEFLFLKNPNKTVGLKITFALFFILGFFSNSFLLQFPFLSLVIEEIKWTRIKGWLAQLFVHLIPIQIFIHKSGFVPPFSLRGDILTFVISLCSALCELQRSTERWQMLAAWGWASGKKAKFEHMLLCTFALSRKLLEARCLNAKNLSACDENFRQVCEVHNWWERGDFFKSHHLCKHLSLSHSPQSGPESWGLERR